MSFTSSGDNNVTFRQECCEFEFYLTTKREKSSLNPIPILSFPRWECDCCRWRMWKCVGGRMKWCDDQRDHRMHRKLYVRQRPWQQNWCQQQLIPSQAFLDGKNEGASSPLESFESVTHSLITLSPSLSFVLCFLLPPPEIEGDCEWDTHFHHNNYQIPALTLPSFLIDVFPDVALILRFERIPDVLKSRQLLLEKPEPTCLSFRVLLTKTLNLFAVFIDRRCVTRKSHTDTRARFLSVVIKHSCSALSKRNGTYLIVRKE